MSTDTKVDTQPAVAENADLLPFSILLELSVQDRDTIAELCAFAEGEQRERFALKALRIGVDRRQIREPIGRNHPLRQPDELSGLDRFRFGHSRL